MNPAIYALPRYSSATPTIFWGATPPRTIHGSTKRYSTQHRGRGKPASDTNSSSEVPH